VPFIKRWCSVLRLLAQIKKRDFWFWQGANRSDTAVGIARICNTARAEKTLFYVPDSVKHCTRGRFGLKSVRA
jgi:hypothetical protein